MRWFRVGLKKESLTFDLGQMGLRKAIYSLDRGWSAAWLGDIKPLVPIWLHIEAVATPGADHTRSKPRQVSVAGVIVRAKRYFMAACRTAATNTEPTHAQIAHVGEGH